MNTLRNLYMLACLTAMNVSAQTLNVQIGEVTYAIPAAQAGDMIYDDGSQLTILGKTFSVDEIGKITVDDTEVTPSAVSVVFNAGKASVLVPYNVMANLSVTADGAHVTIIQDANVAEEITYTLTGTTTNGSFVMDGEFKATVVLDNLTLTNPTGAAIHIKDGKRINVNLVGTSSLADGANGTQKGCFAVKGHTEFDGTGTLNITGNASHGFWGKEYVQLKKGAGTINILKAAADGFNVNQYFQQNGGTVNVKNVGDDGIQVSYKTDDNDNVIVDEENTGQIVVKGGTINVATTAAGCKGLKAAGDILIDESKNTTTITVTNSGAVRQETSGSTTSYTGSSCMKSDTNITIDAGTLTLTNTGQGGRTMKSGDSDNHPNATIIFNGGVVNARAEGANLGSSGGGPGGGPGGGGWGWGGGSTSFNHKYAKAIKSAGNMTFNGGQVTAYSKNHEAIESKGTMTFNDGIVYGSSGSDDAINAAGNMYCNGGYVYGYGAGSDGIDTNGNMEVTGGVMIGFGGSGAESGLDVVERGTLKVTGGYLFSIGGRVDISTVNATQGYATSSSSGWGGGWGGGGSGSVSAPSGGYFVVSTKSGSSYSPMFAIKVPASYSGSVLVSSPAMAKGTTYYISGVSGSSVSGSEVNGFIEHPTATISSGTSLTAK